MPQYRNLRAYSELPAKKPHYTVMRVRRRILIIARNSRRGDWTRYGSYPTIATAESQGKKLAARSEVKKIGRLQTAVRPDLTRSGYWLLFVRFRDLQISNDDLENSIEAAGGHTALDTYERESANGETEAD